MERLLSLSWAAALLAIVIVLCRSKPASTQPATTTAATAETDSPSSATPESRATIVFSDVTWEPLNPARGDKGPQAGTLWGDRNGSGPTGFLLKPLDGFESPHIHNVS